MPPVTKNLLIINIIIWAAMAFVPVIDMRLTQWCALHYFSSPGFNAAQLITYMFMHGGFWHLFFNMYTLFIFGSVLERVWGTRKFLIFYFVTGLGAVALHTGVQWIEAHQYMSQIADGNVAAATSLHALKMTPTVGASGAIYGLLMGYAMLFPDSVLTLIFPPVSLKAKWFVLIFIAIELVTGVFSIGGGIAHFAHLGGMLFGWLMIRYWKRKHKLYQYE